MDCRRGCCRRSLGRKQTAAAEPTLQQDWPQIEGRVAQSETAAVMPMPEQVHFNWNTGGPQCLIVFHACFDRYRLIIRRVINKRRRSLVGDMLVS